MATATVTPLAEVPRSVDVESEVLDAIGARQNLQKGIDDQEGKRERAKAEFAKNFARDTRSTPIDVENAFQRNEAWKAADERAQQRIVALKNILSKVVEYLEQLKKENSVAAISALTKLMEELKGALSEKTEAEADLKKQIKKLQEEIDSLTKATVKKP